MKRKIFEEYKAIKEFGERSNLINLDKLITKLNPLGRGLYLLYIITPNWLFNDLIF